ncbi:MAG TPA: PKD domain-containing protein [Epsilonproteobacteria bacterium]|nr:PKD domain-containing protein [Campylobacterota bacterium]
MKGLKGSIKGFFAIISLVLLGFMQLEASDECGSFLSSSDFDTSINSSSPSYSNADDVKYKNNDSTEDTYYIDVTEAGNITITLNNTSADGDVVFAYSETSCPGAGGGVASQTLTFAAPTDFNLLVYPNSGQNNTDYNYTLEITFTPIATPPTADAGPDQNVAEGASVTLDGSGSSDSDGSIISYSWSDGSTTWTGVNPTISTSGWSTGSHTITLTVEDDDGATDTDTVVITVNAAGNTPPVADAGPDQNVEEGASVTLDGSGSSDSDGSIISYSWSYGMKSWSGVSPTISTSGWSTGNHTITLTVIDDDGAIDTDTVVIRVGDDGGLPIVENANDICYGGVIEQPLDAAYDKRTVPILNQGGSTLTEVSLIDATNGMLDIVPLDYDCGIDDISRKDSECVYKSTESLGDLGLELDWLFSASSLHPVMLYDMPDYTSGASHSIYNKHINNLQNLSGTEIYATYIKDNTLYRGRIQSCDISSDLPYQNQYVCDVFGSVLTTYDHLYANGNNEEVCGTGSIAYPENQITGTIECDQSYTCNGTPTICERTDPPTNRYSHTFIPSTLSGTNNTPSDPTLLQDLNYGNLAYPSNNAGQTIHFDPQTSYEGNTSSIKVMLLGDLYVNGGYTLAFEPGDYYFDSVTIEGNNNEIILPNGGLVRIFIHNDYEVAMNNLATNTAPGSAAGDLFIYVEGDIKDLSNGGGTANLKAYIYVEGSVELNNNSNNWQIYGGITAEGPITINGNNPTFMGTQDSGNTGLGECSMCYDLIQVSGMTFNMLNCGGFGMMQDIKVPIWSTDPVTNVTVDEVHKQSLFNFSFLGDYNVLVQDNQLIANAIEVASGWANGALGMDVSLFGGKAITYPLGSPYGPADAATHYKLHSSSAFSMGINPCDWMESLEYVAHYDDGDRHYDVILDPCRTYVPPTYQTGPFDAWDSFRGDTDGDGKFDDKNISTKVAGKPFELRLVNLDENLTGTELKGINSVVTFKLYDDKGQEISGSYRELHIHDDLSLDTTFTVPYASRAVTVNFRFCSEFDGTTYTLHDDVDCSGDTVPCTAGDTTHPKWRICSSSDQFAVRPDEFAITPPIGEDIGLLTSAVEYPFTVVANDVGGANTNEYNQTGDNITLALNESLIRGDGDYDDEGLLNGTPTLTNTDFFFNNGISNKPDTAGTEVVTMSFDDVGKLTFRLRDSDWSLIDLDDTPQDCNGGTFTNAKNISLDIPYGAYICGEQNATFIPDRFEVTGITLKNHRDGNFTYLSNDLNMSAHVGVQIRALNAEGLPTQNFREGALFYENNVSVELNVTEPNRHPLDNSVNTKDIPNQTLLGFGGADEANGTHAIAWDDSNLTQRLMFNYQRNNNQPVNPFRVPESDINISVASTYTSEASERQEPLPAAE